MIPPIAPRREGMKHHEVVIDFSRRGLVEAFQRLISRKRPPD
jgi:hypothetical protein